MSALPAWLVRAFTVRIKRAARLGDLPDRAPTFSYTGDES
jgi:hypothetical protein